MAELVYEFRGETLENIHNGRIAVVGDDGKLKYHVGDAETMTFYRSSSKPLQTLPIIEHRLDEKYNLSDKEITIMSGSHAGEPIHVQTILSILEKAGYDENDMIMLPSSPAQKEAFENFIKDGQTPRKALHNCAGKHSAGMLLQEHRTGSNNDYWRPESAAQQEIAGCIAEMSSWPVEKVAWGVDGCGVPVFAVPLWGIATSYMHLACPDTVTRPELRRAVEKLVPLIHKENIMMRGTGYLCSVFNEDPDIVAKGGAKGVYGFGIKSMRLGISLKMEDGTEDNWPIVISEILRQLNYTNQDTINKLEKLAPNKLLNDNKTEVGIIRPVFKLQSVI